MHDDASKEPFQFLINIAHNLNNGRVQGSQSCTHPRSPLEVPSASPNLIGSLLVEPVPGFVPVRGIRKARKGLREGLLFLAGERGTGRRTVACALLAGLRNDKVIIRCLSPDVDFATWTPEPGAADGYLVDGSPSLLMQSRAAIVAVRERLMAADAVMVVILPEGVRLDDRTMGLIGPALVRCQPPSAEEVFAARLRAAVPEESERGLVTRGLPPGFLRNVLSRDGSPQDAMDVLEALLDTSDHLHRSRLAAIRSTLDEGADREVHELIPDWFLDKDLRHVLISAAAFVGQPPETVSEQARRLARIAGTVPNEAAPRSLETLLRPVGVRVETVRHSHNDPPVRVVFARSRWAKAILRQVWRGPLAEPAAEWLRSVPEAELIPPAGQALATSAVVHPRHLQLTRIRASAVSRDPRGPKVAAAALRTLVAEMTHADEIFAQLGGWAGSTDERLRYVTALTCGGSAETTPTAPILGLVVRLIRNSDLDPAPRIANAIDEALMDRFYQGDRTVVLQELTRWTESGQAETRYATTLFPRLLSRYLTWFQAHIVKESGRRSVAILIRRVTRSHGSGSRLRDTMLAWQRFAYLSPDGSAPFDALLATVREDRHPAIQQLLAVLDQQY
ncbi:hypothetical protein [Rhizohabitans arisaemae]|uniref:hypothetical protein n=1 Tax=Rhizohabitans arisaemae TaxID=2720610 RepID=UPI0024B25111|nr:hypothetical protein [Rhizohabitans arisaemae]